MKKFISLFIFLLVLLIVFSGCDNGKQYVTIRFHANGGTFVDGGAATLEKVISKGGKTAAPSEEDITRGSGYNFVGWYDVQSSAGGTIYNDAASHNTSKIFYARWEVEGDKVTITFNASPGTFVASGQTSMTIDIVKGDAVPIPPATSASNPSHALEGWYTQTNGNGTKLNATDTHDTDKTFYANWVAAILYVGEMEVFSDRDNDGGNSWVTMTVGERDGTPSYTFEGNVTTQYQYGFAGWLYDPDPDTLEYLKRAKSISFYCEGDGKRYSVKYRLSSVTDHAHHESHFTAPATSVALVNVNVDSFTQPEWGSSVNFNKNLVQEISWQTHEDWRPNSFSITIWNVRIHLE